VIIRIRTRSFRQTRWYEHAIRFVLGGAVTALVGLVADAFGPQVGGLLLAFPSIFPATVAFIAGQERRRSGAGWPGELRGIQAAALSAVGTALGSAGLAAFAVVNGWLLPRLSAPLALALATLGWLLAGSAAWLLWRARHRLS
jgi:uncharacterized membrane protein (GlpM family)